MWLRLIRSLLIKKSTKRKQFKKLNDNTIKSHEVSDEYPLMVEGKSDREETPKVIDGEDQEKDE